MRLLSAFLLSAVVTFGLIARQRAPRLAIEPFPGPARLAAAIVLLTVVFALTVFLPAQGLLGTAQAPDLEGISFLSLFAAHALLAGFLVLWWGLAGFSPPGRFLRLAVGSPARRVALGLAAGLAAWTVTIGAMAVVGALFGLRDGGPLGGPEGAADEIPEVVRFLVGLSAPRRLLLVLSAGVFEEAFFRSFLQPRSGLLLSSILFAMSHASYGLPFMLVGVFTVSMALGILFRATDDVLPCMIAHSVFDAVQLFLILPAVVAGS